MHRNKMHCWGLCLGLSGFSLVLAQPAHAQGTAVLTGTVIDASNKQPVADVAVTVTSPALQGEQIVVTDASGSYRIPQLPPGEYTVRLEKETYRPYARGEVTLRLSSTIRVNVELLPERVKLTENIEVVGKAPTVDIGSTTTGVLVQPDVANRVALNPPGGRSGAVRSFDGLALMAPGVYAEPIGLSVNGAGSTENRFQIDGLSVNSSVDGINDTLLSAEFVKEVNIATGGYMPEFGRAMGGIFDVVTKTGSNELHGSVFGSITPGALEGPGAPVKEEGTVIRTESKLAMLRDFGFDIGGPIVKDRLWFYAGMNFALQDNQLTRTLNRIRYEKNPDGTLKLDGDGNPIRAVDSDGFQLADPIPGTEKVAYASKQTIQYIGKLTWNIRPALTLTLSSYGTPATSGGNGRYSLTHEAGQNYFGSTNALIGPGQYTGHARIERSSIHDASANLSSAFMNKRLLFDAMLGWHHAKIDILPVDGSGVGSGEGVSAIPGVYWDRGQPGPHSIADFEPLPPGTGCEPAGTDAAIYCPVTSYRTGGPGHTEESVENRFHGKVMGTYLLSALGHHVIKAGADVEVATHLRRAANSGGIWFQEGWDGTTFDVFHYGSAVNPDALFVPKVRENSSRSTTIGVFVQDSWNILDRVTLNAGLRYDVQLISTSDGTGITLPDEWSPRVGAIYDFTRSGRSKVFVHYARYYGQMPLGIASFFTSSPFSISTVSRSVCDPRDRSTLAACDAPENRLTRGAPYDPNRKWSVLGGNRTPVDPDLRAASSDEIVLGGEYEIFQNGRAGVTYTHRQLNHGIANMSPDEGTTYFLGNPGHGATSGVPKAARDYDAMTVMFQKSFSSQWLAQASYTLSYLRGSDGGFGVNQDGPFYGDRTHAIKVYGAKEFSLPASWVVNVGLSYQGLSGTPLGVFNGSRLFSGTRVELLLPRGEAGRLPWVHTIDSNVTVGYRIHKDSVLSVSLDVFNLFNFQAVTRRDDQFTYRAVRPIPGGRASDLPNEGETACAATAGCRYKLVYYDGTPFDPKDRNPNYGNPTAYQNPRRFRIGAKVTF